MSVPANVLAWLNYTPPTPATTSTLRNRYNRSTLNAALPGSTSTAQAFCYNPIGTSEGLVPPTGSGLNNGILVAAATSFTTTNKYGLKVPTFPTWPGGGTGVSSYPFIPLSHDYMILPSGSNYYFYNYLNPTVGTSTTNLLTSPISNTIISWAAAFAIPGAIEVYPTAFIWPLDDDAYNNLLCSAGQYPLPLASYNSDASITTYAQTTFPPGKNINPIPEPYRYDVLIGISILTCFFILIVILIIIKASKKK